MFGVDVQTERLRFHEELPAEDATKFMIPHPKRINGGRLDNNLSVSSMLQLILESGFTKFTFLPYVVLIRIHCQK